MQTALTAAAAGDFVVIQRNAVPSGDKELSADITYTVPAGVTVLAATNDGGSDFTYSPMGDGTDWIGNSTVNRSVTFHPATTGTAIRLRGLTLRVSGATTDNINFFTSAQVGQIVADDIYFWNGQSATASRIAFGSTTANQQSVVILNNPTFRFGSTSHSVQVRSQCHLTINGGRIASAGSTPTELFTWSSAGAIQLDVTGFDASVMGSGCTLVGDVGSGANTSAPKVFLRQVRRGASCEVLAAQSVTTRLGIEVFEYECQVGSTLNVSGYHNAFGSVTNDATVYITAGPTEQSWKIVTTSLCSPTLPFMTPWIDWYNTGASSITPRIEVLRTDSTTALTDAQIHGEWTARVTSGSVASTWYSDQAQGATGTAQATGVGTGSWTGAGGTAWSGKLEPPSAITPAAAGRLRGRIVVEAASTTVYADQLIRV